MVEKMPSPTLPIKRMRNAYPRNARQY